MKSPLEKFGRKYLSPSSINGFRNDPVGQCKRMFQKFRDESNLNMERGKVAEKILVMWLKKEIQEQDINILAEKEFTANTIFQNCTEEERAKELEKMIGTAKAPGIIRNFKKAFDELKVNMPIKFQTKHETILKDTNTPIMGYTDMETPLVTVDWKATSQIRQIDMDNRIQGGIYWKFTQKKMLFIKATKTKYEIQELSKEDIYYGLETAVHVIKILENVCNTFDNLDDYYKLIYPGKKWDRSEKLETEVKNQYRNYFGTEAYGGI
jgi:hypothetical protein